MVIGYEEKTQYKPRFPFKRLTQKFVKNRLKTTLKRPLVMHLKLHKINRLGPSGQFQRVLRTASIF